MQSENKILYFAYGSNLNHEQMKQRCPESKFISRVVLKNYKLVYDGYGPHRHGAVANIVPHTGETVWGGLFELSQNDLNRLDKFEGYPDVYSRKEASVENDKNDIIEKVFIYYKKPEAIGNPSQGYQYIIVKGAEECGLPKDYIDKILKVL